MEGRNWTNETSIDHVHVRAQAQAQAKKHCNRRDNMLKPPTKTKGAPLQTLELSPPRHVLTNLLPAW